MRDLDWRAILWPINVAEATTPLVRLGRVLHWTGVVLAAPWVALAVALAFEDGAHILGLALIGLPFYFIGRALRYVLANE